MNILVVTTVENADAALRRHISGGDTVKVVVPAVKQRFVDWLANDQEAFDRAQAAALSTAERLPGETEEAAVGEADVDLAIHDALATFPADEIIVAVQPDEQAGAVEATAAKKAD